MDPSQRCSYLFQGFCSPLIRCEADLQVVGLLCWFSFSMGRCSSTRAFDLSKDRKEIPARILIEILGF